MKKKRYTEEQIIGFLREADAGLPVKDRKHFSIHVAEVDPGAHGA